MKCEAMQEQTDGYYMGVVPCGVTEIDQRNDRHKEIDRELEHLEIGTSHNGEFQDHNRGRMRLSSFSSSTSFLKCSTRVRLSTEVA
jgi:hypothetical protein